MVNRCLPQSHLTFPCRGYNKNDYDKEHAIQCDICNFSVHIKCNNLNYIDYKHLQGNNGLWYCITCSSSIFPFKFLNNKNSASLVISQTEANNYNFVSNNSSLLLNPSQKPINLVNQFNNNTIIDNDNKVTDNFIHSKYFDTDEIQKLKILNKEKCLSLFHVNTCSLSKNFDELQHLLKITNKNFDVIAITETSIRKDVTITSNLSLNNYSMEFTPTESSAGGTLLYIANHLSYKSRNDLNIYKKSELESTFIEVINPQKSNIIIGSIYRHPSMDLDDFNKNFLNKLLEKVSKEQKSVYLLGDFNVNLLNYNGHNPNNEFLDSVVSNSFIPYILQPTRITDHSEAVIDKISSNVITVDAISGNLTATISDHLPQIIIVPNVFANSPSKISNIYERDWSNFDQVNVDCFSID